MIFTAILLISALFLTAVGGFFSICGLTQLFSGLFLPIILMGVALEIGKLSVASFLYRYWKKISWLMKGYMITATAVLMLITSAGIYGMLANSYQRDSQPLKETTVTLTLLTQEQESLSTRKKEIDKQIAQISPDYVTARQRLMSSFSLELNQINKRLPEITAELQRLSAQQIQQNAHVGPIIFIAKAMNRDTDDAALYMIMLIIFVFDPLAIALTLAVNIVIIDRNKKVIQEQTATQELPKVPPVAPVPAQVTSPAFHWETVTTNTPYVPNISPTDSVDGTTTDIVPFTPKVSPADSVTSVGTPIAPTVPVPMETFSLSTPTDQIKILSNEEPSPAIDTVQQLDTVYKEPAVLSTDEIVPNTPTSQVTTPKRLVRRLFSGPYKDESSSEQTKK